MKAHGFRSGKVDRTETLYRFRQIGPAYCDPRSYRTLARRLPIGVQLVVCDVNARGIRARTRRNPDSGEAAELVARLRQLGEKFSERNRLLAIIYEDSPGTRPWVHDFAEDPGWPKIPIVALPDGSILIPRGADPLWSYRP